MSNEVASSVGINGLDIDETLVNSLILAGQQGLEMVGVDPNPIGASSHVSVSRDISILVSLIGSEVNGTLTLNIARPAAIFMVSNMLGEEQDEVNEDVLDGICEIGNMVAGSIKTFLTDTKFEFDAISCPALIVGASYNLYHYRGFNTVAVDFEIKDMPLKHLSDRFFSTSVSLVVK